MKIDEESAMTDEVKSIDAEPTAPVKKGRGRPAKATTEKRTIRVSLYLNEEEKARLELLAGKLGTSFGNAAVYALMHFDKDSIEYADDAKSQASVAIRTKKSLRMQKHNKEVIKAKHSEEISKARAAYLRAKSIADRAPASTKEWKQELAEDAYKKYRALEDKYGQYVS